MYTYIQKSHSALWTYFSQRRPDFDDENIVNSNIRWSINFILDYLYWWVVYESH